jgi:hypothetical protein
VRKRTQHSQVTTPGVYPLTVVTTELNPQGHGIISDDTETPLTNLHTPAPKVMARKRKRTLEDQFSDIEVDDLELDEDDLKELDRLESPEKLPNGNYRCNHLCKDRKRWAAPFVICGNE